MFSPHADDAPQVLTCRAHDVQPGDEVVIVDPGGAHHVVHCQYTVIDPARTSVTMVPGDGAEQRVGYDDRVMVLRGVDVPTLLTREAPRP